ncbi:MAG: TIGR01777 family oxidoreductase [Myxococcota bacterium]
MPTYRLRTPIPNTTASELYAWHARPGAFERLNPPWDPIRVMSRTGSGVETGVELELQAHVGPIPLTWRAVHTEHEPGRRFVDEQRSGPFAYWRHQHLFTEADPGEALLEDCIEWRAPFGALGAAIGGVQSRLDRVFPFRHRRTADDLARHARYRDRPRLRVLISGASGLIGSQLTAFLDAGGHEVVPLVRSSNARGRHIPLDDPEAIDREWLEGFDAVVHLQGAPIADESWTDARKQVIRHSRVHPTAVLARVMGELKRPPKVFLSASAVGLYGDTGDTEVDEAGPTGDTFLASVGAEWEAATSPARDAGIRTVLLRTGFVLSGLGGYLKAQLPLFQFGLGGPVGGGQQWVPWIHLDDHLGLMHEALFDDRYEGPLNLVAPRTVRQFDFARAMGRVLGRPAFAPAPGFAIKLALGRQRGLELVLQGQRVVPAKAQALGYRFLHPELDNALRFELGR